MAVMEDEEALFYDPRARKVVYRRHLPHWNQPGRVYFVTFRLADSIPASRAEELGAQRRLWLRRHHEPYVETERREYHRLFTARIERWLDDCRGSCVLAEPECAQILVAALEAFDGQRYHLDEWVVMPNHVHVLVKPRSGFDLKRIVQGWKSFTAHAINRRLGRHGRLWQQESFDHIVRSSAHLDRFRRYIRVNPIKAGHLRDQCRLRPS